MRISDWSSDVCSSDLYLRYQWRLRARGRDGTRRAFDPAQATRDRADHAHPACLFRPWSGSGPRAWAHQTDHLDRSICAPVLVRRQAHDRLLRLRVLDRRQSSPVCRRARSEEHTSELQSLMRISYAVFCLKKKNKIQYIMSVHETVTSTDSP